MFAVHGAWQCQLIEFGLDTVIYCAPSDASTRFNSHVPEWREFLSNVVAMLSLYCFTVMLMLIFLVLIESDIDAFY